LILHVFKNERSEPAQAEFYIKLERTYIILFHTLMY